jgi:hypothetical protein
MDDEQGHSVKLLAAAGLAFCGVIMLAVGIATAGVPLQRPVCLSLAPSPNAALQAELAPRVSGPNVHAMRIVTD